MKTEIEVVDNEEAALICEGLADPEVRALVKIMAAVMRLPTDQARERTWRFVADGIDELASREQSEPQQCDMSQQNVCSDILDIMATYHEQDEKGNIDTPGGLEHMGDVWALFRKWERLLKGEAWKL